MTGRTGPGIRQSTKARPDIWNVPLNFADCPCQKRESWWIRLPICSIERPKCREWACTDQKTHFIRYCCPAYVLSPLICKNYHNGRFFSRHGSFILFERKPAENAAVSQPDSTLFCFFPDRSSLYDTFQTKARENCPLISFPPAGRIPQRGPGGRCSKAGSVLHPSVSDGPPGSRFPARAAQLHPGCRNGPASCGHG